jgi:hypothetical protein
VLLQAQTVPVAEKNLPEHRRSEEVSPATIKGDQVYRGKAQTVARNKDIY